ncbi:DUF3617 domain-containing protein [Roseateles flavus]|uniref:DUF3617 domain-containing protein n=1 Tax=Roseateles flavus TaxID=3149041 RepID=A0ABV0GGZ1_9BURK
MKPIRRPRAPRAALAALLALPLCASAQSTMKPGLWEMTQKPQLDPAQQAKMDQARQAMANMPPEKRQMMEQMMAQHGVQVNMGAGGTVTIKTCISKEQAERHEPPVDDKGRCKQQVTRSGNTVRSHFTCTDPASEGDGEFTFDSAEHYSSKLSIQRQGRSMTISGEGRWLGADCGSIQPHKPRP